MRIMLAALAALGLTASAQAQFTTPGTPVGTPLAIGNAGDPAVMPVGGQVGGQVGSAPGGIMDSVSQDFSKIDKSRLAAPLPVYPGIGGDPSLWDRFTQRIIAAVNYINPFYEKPVPRPPWVPGISRRNRERAEARMWRPD